MMLNKQKAGLGEDKYGRRKKKCIQQHEHTKNFCRKSSPYDMEMEQILRQSAGRLPEPCGRMPVSDAMKARNEKFSRYGIMWRLGRTAAAAAAFVLLGGGTAAAASPAVRQAVIRFFTDGTKERVPEELLKQNDQKKDSDAGDDTGVQTNGAAGDDAGVQTNKTAGDNAGVQKNETAGGDAGVQKNETAGGDAGVQENETAGDDAGMQKNESVTVGDVTWVKGQKLDEHFTASYLSSCNYLDLVETSSGNLLFYTADAETGRRTYYQMADGVLQSSEPAAHVIKGHVSLGTLYGIMSYEGESYGAVTLPEMTFAVDWQQYGEEDILPLNTYMRQFEVGSTFGEAEGSGPLTGSGSFCASALKGDTEWVEVSFLYDVQRTEYCYPFLLNIRTKEVRNPLADVDLSQYPCITNLSINDDKKTASAKAGADHDSLKDITIDLTSGAVTEDSRGEEKLVKEAMQQKEAAGLLADDIPREDHSPEEDSSSETAFATSDHTVFYTTGTMEHTDGYLYNAKTKKTSVLFKDAAWGYMWEHGFADRYVSLIGGNYAVLYKEPENEVYLLDLADGGLQLLEGIPASHDVSFFWNNERSILSISVNTEAGASRLAFFMPRTDHAWYFDRSLADDVHEVMSCWYGEHGYLIQAVSEDRDQYYLYLYEYTP